MIELEQGSIIEFVNSNNINGELLDAWELWEPHETQDICEQVPEFCEDSGVCSVNPWGPWFCGECDVPFPPSPEDCNGGGGGAGGDINEGINALVINNEGLINGNAWSYLSCLIGVGGERLFVNIQNFEETLDDVAADGNDNNHGRFLSYYNNIIIPQVQYQACRRNDIASSPIIDTFQAIAQEPVTREKECKGKVHCTKKCFCIQRCGFLNWRFGKRPTC